MNNKFRSIKIMSVLSTIFIFLLNFDFAFAKFSYQPLSPLPGTTETTSSGEAVTNLASYISGLYKIVIGVAIILAVLSFIIAGLEWMTAEAVGKKQDAIKKINAALFGLLLTLGSWLFLNTINPATVTFSLKLNEISLVDGSRPILYGWYCQNADKTWSQPYQTSALCMEATKCGTSCEEIQTQGIGGNQSNNTGAQFLTKYYDDESGWYFLEKPNMSNIDDREPNGPHDDKDSSEPTCEVVRQQWIANNPDNQAPGPCYLQLGPNDDRLSYILLDETRVRNILYNDAKITINRTQCTSIEMDSCTNVGGLEDKTINGLKLLRTLCPDCTLVLTAGTEWFLHTGGKDYDENKVTCHRPLDSKNCSGAVDIRFTTSSNGNGVYKDLNKFIAENVNPPVIKTLGDSFTPEDMTKWYPTNMDGAWFRFELKETPHWHVQFP